MMSIFDVIADSTRRQILDLLLKRPHLVGELVEKLEISQPGVSKHLRVLRENDLVEVQPEAQRRWYALRPEPLQEVDQWLNSYRQVWEERFDNLDAYLEQVQRENEDENDADSQNDAV